MNFTTGEVAILCGLAVSWGTLMWRVGVMEAERKEIRRFIHWIRNWTVVAEQHIPDVEWPKERDAP